MDKARQQAGKKPELAGQDTALQDEYAVIDAEAKQAVQGGMPRAKAAAAAQVAKGRARMEHNKTKAAEAKQERQLAWNEKHAGQIDARVRTLTAEKLALEDRHATMVEQGKDVRALNKQIADKDALVTRLTAERDNLLTRETGMNERAKAQRELLATLSENRIDSAESIAEGKKFARQFKDQMSYSVGMMNALAKQTPPLPYATAMKFVNDSWAAAEAERAAAAGGGALTVPPGKEPMPAHAPTVPGGSAVPPTATAPAAPAAPTAKSPKVQAALDAEARGAPADEMDALENDMSDEEMAEYSDLGGKL